EGEQLGLIQVMHSPTVDGYYHMPRHILIQGLHLRNAYEEHSFTAHDGSVVPYFDSAAGIFIRRGQDITVRGVIIEGNGNGLVVRSSDGVDAQDDREVSRRIVLARSRIFGNGTYLNPARADRHHNIYTEAAGMTLQYNDFGPLRANPLGG